MQVEFLRPVAGLAYFTGDVAELPDARARQLIEVGFCVPVKSETYPVPDEHDPETSELPQQGIENAARKTAKGKGKK